MRLWALAATVLVLVVPGTAAGQTLTLEQVMSAPFPSELVVAPAGDRFAWVQNAEGVRNIWVAEGPSYRGRQVTAYAEDDGQELADLMFTADGSRIVFVRGGAPNRQGETPNPTSHPDGAERAIWVVPFAGGEPRQVLVGAGAVLSPRADRIAYARGGSVSTISIDEGKAERLFTIRGSAGSLRWSPDGSKLAFISSRGDHAFVGVFDIASRALRYVDPSVDRDGAPIWSADGARIAFLRIPNRRTSLPFAPVREAEPWSIRVADVATGSSREIWRAPRGAGSAFQGVVADNALLWASGDRLVFPWEGDGWLHLYSMPAAGGRATLLTPGEFEVEDVVLSADKSDVIFSSNQGDVDRRHLWRVSAAGGSPRAVTTGTGIEWSPRASGGAIAFFASDAVTPARVEVLVQGTRRAMAPETMPRAFPSGQLVAPQQVVFSAADGMRIHAQLFTPRGARAGQRHPAVVFFHGGSRRQMLLGFHYRGYYHNAYALNQYLASRGYVVLSVNYRSGTGYGMAFREALNYGATGASEFQDVVGAGLYLRRRNDVDPDRIGLWGGSYGGYLTALGLARASDLFAAGVDIHGVHDWNVGIHNFRPDYDPKDDPEFARTAFESSPMAHVDGWRSPVLLIHGDDDRNVKFSETVDLVEALRKRNVEFEQVVLPDEVHSFLLHRSWLTAYRATAEFFDRKLRTAGAATGARPPSPQ